MTIALGIVACVFLVALMTVAFKSTLDIRVDSGDNGSAITIVRPPQVQAAFRVADRVRDCAACGSFVVPASFSSDGTSTWRCIGCETVTERYVKRDPAENHDPGDEHR